MNDPSRANDADRIQDEILSGASRTRAEDKSASLSNEMRTVKSADRVLALFELLGNGNREMSHSDIASFLGIPKSSLTQLLKNLVHRGWLSYDAAGKSYALGDAIERIARTSKRVPNLIDIAGPILADLAADTNETAAINILRGDEAETLATVLGGETLLAVLRAGQRAPLYTTSYGKVMLAHMPQDELEDYLKRVELAPLTPRTILSQEELRLQIDTVKRDGFGYSFEEQVRGVVGVARAVFGSDGRLLAALNVAAASVRFDREARLKITDALAEAVHRLQKQIKDLDAA
jgi:DNA-binding IclR family transcriptional regulator